MSEGWILLIILIGVPMFFVILFCAILLWEKIFECSCDGASDGHLRCIVCGKSKYNGY